MTDIPEWAMLSARRLQYATPVFDGNSDTYVVTVPTVADIARAIMDARDKALEDAATMVSKRFAGTVPGWIEDDIRAMKSTGREKPSQTAHVLTDAEDRL